MAEQTKYFSAATQYQSMDAHKAAEKFQQEIKAKGFISYQATYGQYGFSVTYWPKEQQ